MEMNPSPLNVNTFSENHLKVGDVAIFGMDANSIVIRASATSFTAMPVAPGLKNRLLAVWNSRISDWWRVWKLYGSCQRGLTT